MKIIVNTIRVYEYHELDDSAKERVKEWYLDDIWRNNSFQDDIEGELECLFPNSKLKVCYSLSNCQGDGLNVYGTIKLTDFLNMVDGYTSKEINRLRFYFRYFNEYTFESDNRYCYSCKFIDKKRLEWTAIDLFNALEWNGIRYIDSKLVYRFLLDMFNWFEDYDRRMEEYGYKFFYEVAEGEVEEVCASNGWMFLEDGEFYRG